MDNTLFIYIAGDNGTSAEGGFVGMTTRLQRPQTPGRASRNLAEGPAKLKEMQALFMTEAEKYHVLPIDDRTIERTNPALAGRPDVLGDRKSLTLYEGMQGMLENTFMNIKNRSSRITAELGIPSESRASGVILSRADALAAGRSI